MDGWIGGWETDEWMNECSGWIGQRVRQRRIEDAWVNGYTDGRMDGWEWIDGWVE